MDSDVMRAAREAVAACGGPANCEAWVVNQSRNKHVVALALAGIEAATQPNPWTPSGADWDYSLHQNPRADAWAKAFVQTFPGLADKEGVMVGWFANAMMAMHDHVKGVGPLNGDMAEAMQEAATQPAEAEAPSDAEIEAAIEEWVGRFDDWALDELSRSGVSERSMEIGGSIRGDGAKMMLALMRRNRQPADSMADVRLIQSQSAELTRYREALRGLVEACEAFCGALKRLGPDVDSVIVFKQALRAAKEVLQCP